MRSTAHSQTIIACTFLVLVLIGAAVAGCTGTQEAGITPPATAATPPATDLPSPPATPPVTDTAGCSPITITQTNGKDVTLPCMPKRIIVTNSDAAEMLIALGAADTIVGVTDSTKNITSIMEKIPRAESIGDWQTPNIEKMLALRPDVVISYASSKPKNLDRILAANITIVYLDCYRLPKLALDARAMGILTGHEKTAEEYAGMVENTTTTVMRRVNSVSRDQLPAVYFEGYSDYTAAGPGSGSDELLVMAGGKNIASNLSSSSPKVSAEWVVAQKPAYVMKVVSSKETRPFPELARSLSSRTGWNTIPAVTDGRIYLFSSGVEYGPKSYIGLAYTAKILHPDLFADLDPDAMLNEYAARYVTGSNMSVPVYP